VQTVPIKESNCKQKPDSFANKEPESLANEEPNAVPDQKSHSIPDSQSYAHRDRKRSVYEVKRFWGHWDTGRIGAVAEGIGDRAFEVVRNWHPERER
jgi:hypothetical protein